MENIELESLTEEQLLALKQQANSLVQSLDESNLSEAKKIIHELGHYESKSISLDPDSLRDLLSSIHDVTRELQINEETAELVEDEESVNVSDRLDYIVQVTQKAANETMDAIDLGLPIAASLHDTSQALLEEWGKLKRRELKVGEFNQLSKRLDGFLSETCQQTEAIKDNYNKILITQEFQDLTGQVVQKIMALMQTVEHKVSELLQSAQSIEQTTGVTPECKEKANSKGSSGEGPQIKADQREDVVSGQDDVDDLLSSLGI